MIFKLAAKWHQQRWIEGEADLSSMYKHCAGSTVFCDGKPTPHEIRSQLCSENTHKINILLMVQTVKNYITIITHSVYYSFVYHNYYACSVASDIVITIKQSNMFIFIRMI